MNRSGGFVLLLMALGVTAALYLLLGDSLGGGEGVYDDGADGSSGGTGNALASTGLEAGGAKPKSAEELAAEKAAEEGEKVVMRPEEGVFGTVTDGSGAPIAGATISLFAEPIALRMRTGIPDGEPLAVATSGEDGSFVVSPSPLDGHAKVRADAVGYAPTVQRVKQRGARVDIIMDVGGRMEVRVLDRAGEAVPGAQVVHSAGLVVTSQLTGEGGRTVFASLPTGTGQVVVVKEGYGVVRENNVAIAPGETEERTFVLPKGLEVRGIVQNAETERPEPGVEITARYPQLPMLEESTPVVTDEEGRFKLTAWVGGNEQFLLRARKKEFAEARAYRSARHKGEATLKLHKAGEALEGRVVTASRQPASGVRVTYVGMQWENRSDVPEAQSDGDGNFTLPLPAWAAPNNNFNVVALSTSDGVAVGYARVPKKGAPAKEIELTLGGVGRVAGIVKDKSGAPVQGAVVSLAPDWGAMQKNSGGGRMPWQLLNALGSGEFHNLTGLSGMDGRYEIQGVPALHYKVTATFGLDSFMLPDAVQVSDGERADADIELGEGGTIEGRVLDSEDKPIPGAYVTASPMQQNRGMGWWQGRPTARSQSDGRFIIRGVADERYTVTAYAASYGNATEKNVSKGQTDLTIRLKARGWIIGIITLQGEPYRGTFTVTAKPVKSGGPSAPMMNGMWSPGQQIRTFNTDDGKFILKGCNAGDYNLSATTSEGMIAVQSDLVTVVDGRPSREATLALSEGAVISGVVKSDDTGEPIPNAWIYAQGKAPAGGGQTPPSGNGQTDSKGKYEIKGLGTGSYTISAYVGGTPVQKQVDLQIGEKRQVNLARLAPGSIQFIVVDEAGAPVAGARCQVRTATGTWVNPNWQALRKEGLMGDNFDWNAFMNTNAEGALTRYHVPPGILTVWATKSGYQLAGERQQVEVATGRVTQVEVKLKKSP